MCYAVIQSLEDSYSLNLALFWQAEGTAYLQFSHKTAWAVSKHEEKKLLMKCSYFL